MKITIFKKQILFSHKPGVCFLIPKTSYCVKIYPTRIELKNLEGVENLAFNWNLGGPVEKFMASLDLEKEKVELSGNCQKGFFRLSLYAKEKKIFFTITKAPEEGIVFDTLGKVLPQEERALVENISICQTSAEKLSFGVHKALDVTKIEERNDLKEIFPLLFSLKQKIEIKEISHRQGMAKYLDFPEEKKALEKSFFTLFKGGFSSFVPKLTDDCLGYLPHSEKTDQKASPLILLKEIGDKIRLLFFTQKKNHFFLLSKLLQPFICGRMIDIDCNGLGVMDFEWSERRLRKVIFTPKVIGEIVLHPPKDISSFRVRYFRNDKGKTLKSGDTITICDKTPLFFDRFEK